MKPFKYYATKATQLCSRTYRHLLYRLHGKLHDTVTIRTMHGLLTVSTRDDGIGLPLFRERQYEYDSSIRALKFLKSSGFIPTTNVSMLDIGANIGLISIGLILSGEIDRALAIEPEPHNFGLLTKNIVQNNLTEQMLCIQMAVGDKESILNLELSTQNPGDHRIRVAPTSDASEHLGESGRQTIQVKSLPLLQIMERSDVKNFGASLPSFMWIDVQGYEGYVFRGGRSLLEKGLPTVSEIWPYGILRAGMSLEDFVTTVSTIWTDYWIDRGGRFTRYPITVFDRYLEELGTAGYFENVIFTKRLT
ncbi:MAG: FkbM family methyltransferase [Desulfuromonadales bacterium]|nr:FkbM family methyltransferase [Desulfuromonadales bacterium]